MAAFYTRGGLTLTDILKKNYKLVEGVGESGGYHAQVFMSSLFSQMDFS